MSALAQTVNSWVPHLGAQTEFLQRIEFEVLFGGAAGPGKMLALYTPIPTSAGWATMGSLQVGDEIFSDAGEVCTVVQAHPVNLKPESYRLTFDDGETIDACADHLWFTYTARDMGALLKRTDEYRARRRAKRPSRANWNRPDQTRILIDRNKANPPPKKLLPTGSVKTTKEIAATLTVRRGRCNHAIPVAKPLDLPDADLPIDPYIFGAWLGDGTSKAGAITSEDPEIPLVVGQDFERGFLTEYAGNKSATFGFLGLSPLLRKLGVFGNKHIPPIYLRAALWQRLALLQGLMDTDGGVADRSVEFTSTNKEIAKGAHELICSLGWKARIAEGRATLYGKDCGPKYRINWTPSEPVFRLGRKLGRQQIATRRTTKFRYIKSCVRINSVPMRCITVDSQSGLYLAGRNMVPTHNTDCLVAAMLRDIAYPQYHGLICRRTFPQLQEIIDRCFALYPRLGGHYRATDKRWLFPSGAKIDLGHMQHENDKYNYQGKEFHKVAFDELTQFTETQYLYLHSRVRTTDPEITCQILSSSNPGGVGHAFVKERFQPGERDLKTYYDPRSGLSRVFVPATVDDNPSLFLTDPEYVARLEGLPEIERKRLRLGNWDAFEGQIFTELLQSIQGYEDFPIPPEWERFCVFDWGFARPFSVGWYAVDYDGRIYRYREWYGSKRDRDGEAASDRWNEGLKMMAWEVAKGILDIEREAGETIKRRIADSSIWGKHPDFRKKEARGPTIEEDFSNEGIYFIKADRDRVAGKQQVHKRLKPDTEIDEETGEVISQNAMLMVANSCKNFWRTMVLLQEDKKNPDDVSTDQEDHIYDEVRYMCMARPMAVKKVDPANPESFKETRTRLIRAKKRARRMGISVAEAYRRK